MEDPRPLPPRLTQRTDVSRFLGELVHELGTPLASTLMLLDLAEQDLGSDVGAARDKLDSLRHLADEIRRLLRNLSELTKIDSGRRPVEPTAVDLGELLEQLDGAAVGASGETVHVRRDGELPTRITTDPLALRSALDLAAGFAVERGGAAEIVVRSVDGHLEFSLATAAPEDASWRPGVGNLARARRYLGPGLELALALTIVRALGGDLAPDPERLTLRLPVASPTPRAAGPS